MLFYGILVGLGRSLITLTSSFHSSQQDSVAVAHWAHNPKVLGSNPSLVTHFYLIPLFVSLSNVFFFFLIFLKFFSVFYFVVAHKNKAIFF